MRTRLHPTMMASALAVLALAAGLALAPAGQALAASAGQVPATAGGTQLWSTFGDLAHQGSAAAMVTSPDGGVAFVTGTVIGTPTGAVYLTIAYNASTGTKLWARRYINPDGFSADASAMAISPDGSVVYVTGAGEGAVFGDDFTTIAYNASTGKQLWTALYNDSGDGTDRPSTITVAPDGHTVYVSGSGQISGEITPGCDMVAYNATTGTQIWARRYDPSPSPTIGCQVGSPVAVGPGGGTVFVAATTYTRVDFESQPTGQKLATIAYNARTGAIRWLSTYSAPENGAATAAGLAVNPGGHQVFVTGSSQDPKSNADYATIAYSAATGKQDWIARYNGPANRADLARGLVVGSGGKLVIVTGSSKGKTTGFDYATVAYSAATGHQAWATRYNGPGNMADLLTGIAAGPGGRIVFVTGISITSDRRVNFGTVSYNAATGAQRWAATFAGPAGRAQPGPIAVSQVGGKVFVSGFAVQNRKNNYSPELIDTVAYQA